MITKTDQYAIDLIQAVQSGNVDNLKAVVLQLEEMAEWEWLDEATRPKGPNEDRSVRRKNYIDSQFGPLGLTALHVAVKGYATHTREHGEIFDKMTKVLLDAGANYAIPFGVKRGIKLICGMEIVIVVNPGRTIAEECKGNLPPSLRGHLANISPVDEVEDPTESEVQPNFV